ncbi:MAG: 16S rRNA processing protein RimM [Clostridiales bacterium]|nr:16S rRNA processing protein RimM [Clostridiales bacterium]
MAVNQFIVIGKITSAHGIRGEVKVYPLTDDPKRFLNMKDCHIAKEDGTPVSDTKVNNARIDKAMVIVKLDGVDDRNAAEALRDKYLSVDRADAVKDDDSFFIVDMIGMTVIDDDLGELGTIDDVFETGANFVISVKRKGKKDLLIPFLKAVCYDTDIESSVMKVKLPEGLIEIYD